LTNTRIGQKSKDVSGVNIYSYYVFWEAGEHDAYH
jgi:hypothetical protein